MATKFLEPGTDATQDFSFYTSTPVTGTGAVTSDSSIFHTGTRSIKCNSGASNGSAIAITPSVLSDSGSRISFWFRFNQAPSTGNESFALLYKSDSTTIVATIQLTTAARLTVAPTGGTASNGTTVLSVNTWYRLCISYFITNTTTYRIKLFLNNVLEANASAGTLTNTGTDRVGFRVGNGNGNNNFRWFDNIYVDDGASSGSQTDPGDIRVTAKRPLTNGVANDFTTQIGSGGSGYGSGHAPQVNEQPLSQTNGWSMIGAGSAVTEEYNIEGVSVGDVDLTGAQIVDIGGWVFAKALVSETASLVLLGNTSNVALTSTPTLFRAYTGTTTYPLDEGTDIGLITTTALTTVSLYECGILIAFNVAPTGVLVRGNSWMPHQAVQRAAYY